MALVLKIDKTKQIRLNFDEEQLKEKLDSLVTVHGELFVIDIVDYLMSMPMYLIHRTIINKIIEGKEIDQILIFAPDEILIQQEPKEDDLPYTKSSSGK